MTNGWPKKPGRKKSAPLRPHEIRGAKYLRRILDLLSRLRSHPDCPNRLLHYDEYVAYVLLYYFTPVVESMRALQQASEFEVVHRKLGLPRFSRSSFSEASRVFDPTLLHPIIEDLAALGHSRLCCGHGDSLYQTSCCLPPIASILRRLRCRFGRQWPEARGGCRIGRAEG